MVSQQYETVHHQLRVGNVPYSELFPKMVWHNDEPLDFANSVHIFALSQLAKKHVTVVLTGEGSDELFAGYPRYRIPELAQVVPAVYPTLGAPGRSDRCLRDHRVEKLERYARPTVPTTCSSTTPATCVRTGRPRPVRSLHALGAAYRRECLAGSDALGSIPSRVLRCSIRRRSWCRSSTARTR